MLIEIFSQNISSLIKRGGQYRAPPVSKISGSAPEECEWFSKSKKSASECWLAFAWFFFVWVFFCQYQPGVACKSLVYNKRCICLLSLVNTTVYQAIQYYVRPNPHDLMFNIFAELQNYNTCFFLTICFYRLWLNEDSYSKYVNLIIME